MSAVSPSRRSVLAGVVAAGALATPAGAAPKKAEPRPKDHAFEVLEVGPGKRFPSLTKAGEFMNSQARWNNSYAGPERLSRMGFRVIVSPGPPGYYVNDSGTRSRRWKNGTGWPPYEGLLYGPVVIEGEPGKPAPLLETDGNGDGVLYYQTGLFATGNFDATFRRLAFKGFRRKDGQGNYAALRLGQKLLETAPLNGHVLIEDCEFSVCDDGVLGGSRGQRVTLRRCYFHDNGNQTGRTHNIYIGAVDELTVEDLLSTRCTIGHLLKTRAARTVIRNARLLGGGGTESACLDVPDGGVLEAAGLVCEKSADSDAHWLIHYGGENQDSEGVPFHLPARIRLNDVVLLAPPRLRRHFSEIVGFANQSGAGPQASGRDSRLVPVEASEVRVHGLTARTAGLPCRVLPARPAVDARSPIRA
jgi:hypothetical protein